MATTFTTQYYSGTNTSILTTELNSLANNTGAISSAITFSETDYLMGLWELVVTFGVAPSANTGVSVWILAAPDGTNYEDGSSSVFPQRSPDIVLPCRAITTAQRIIKMGPLLPGTTKFLLKNDGTGQTMAASGNTLKIQPITFTNTAP